MRVLLERYGASNSARALADRLHIPRARLVRTRFQPRRDDVIINWGRSDRRFECGTNYLNMPEAVKDAANKLHSFHCFAQHDVPTVPWTEDTRQATLWLDEGAVVLCRDKLTGNSGEGIRVLQPRYGATYTVAPLYTQYVKKKDEYRVHVIDGKVVRIQQKRRRLDEEGNQDADNAIRNTSNGWVFCQEDINAPECVAEAGLAAVQALGLDFGGADVGYNEHYDRAYVYEVNTAPGLEGSTLEAYAEGLRELVWKRGRMMR